MWRRRLNSATLATATHRKLGKVADETSTQVNGSNNQQVEGEDDSKEAI